MPEFRPFRGIRYTTDDLDAVTAPPYDVIDPPERDALLARDPHNAVQLILPSADGDDPDGYARAAATVDAWLADGTLARDDAPTFYAYRMTYADDTGAPRHTVGVLGGLVLPTAAGEGDVLPHERTLPKAKSDRLALLRATRANLDPIWGLTPAAGIAAIADRALPLAKTVDETGVTHELGAITDAGDVDAVRAVVGQGPVVLADGHHRFETAITYRDERRAAGIGAPGDDAVLCLMVELADDQLWVQPIHRLLRGVASATRLRLDLGARCRILDAAPNTPAAVAALTARLRSDGGVGLVDAEGVARLVADPDALDAARSELEPVLADVASAWFEAVAGDALTAYDITYRHDATAIAAMVARGDVDAAILLPAVTVAQIRAAADAARAHAAEDHVLRAEAAHRTRLPRARRRLSAPDPYAAGCAGPERRSDVASVSEAPADPAEVDPAGRSSARFWVGLAAIVGVALAIRRGERPARPPDDEPRRPDLLPPPGEPASPTAPGSATRSPGTTSTARYATAFHPRCFSTLLAVPRGSASAPCSITASPRASSAPRPSSASAPRAPASAATGSARRRRARGRLPEPLAGRRAAVLGGARRRPRRRRAARGVPAARPPHRAGRDRAGCGLIGLAPPHPSRDDPAGRHPGLADHAAGP